MLWPHSWDSWILLLSVNDTSHWGSWPSLLPHHPFSCGALLTVPRVLLDASRFILDRSSDTDFSSLSSLIRVLDFAWDPPCTVRNACGLDTSGIYLVWAYMLMAWISFLPFNWLLTTFCKYLFLTDHLLSSSIMTPIDLRGYLGSSSYPVCLLDCVMVLHSVSTNYPFCFHLGTLALNEMFSL